MSMEALMDDYRLPDSEIFALKPSDKVIRHKTLKVKREADKVKAVYSHGSGYQVKVVADLLDRTALEVFQRKGSEQSALWYVFTIYGSVQEFLSLPKEVDGRITHSTRTKLSPIQNQYFK